MLGFQFCSKFRKQVKMFLLEQPGTDCRGVGFSAKAGFKFVCFRLSSVDASQDGRSGGCKTPQGGVKYRCRGRHFHSCGNVTGKTLLCNAI